MNTKTIILTCCLATLLLTSCASTQYVAQHQVTMPIYSNRACIEVSEDWFNNNSGANFFIGEFGYWLKNRGIDVVINRDIGSQGMYIVPYFRPQYYLRWDGCWIWIFHNVYIDIYSSDRYKLKTLYLGEIKSGTSPGNLRAVFTRSITLTRY